MPEIFNQFETLLKVNVVTYIKFKPLHRSAGSGNQCINLSHSEEFAIVFVCGIADLPEDLVQLIEVCLLQEDI